MDQTSSLAPGQAPKKEHFLIETLKFILLALIIVLPIRLVIAEPFIVSGSSMDPTFKDSQYLIVDRLTYHFENPERNAVIVFRPPVDPSKYYIKRIIGLPGETLILHGDQVTIKNKESPDGFALDQSYVKDGNTKTADMTITLSDDQYFVMGDNRDASSDSRSWGPIVRAEIIGRPAVRLFPFQTISVYPGQYPNQS